MGWDKLREISIEQMKKLGVVPEDTVLAAKPEGVPDWDSLSETERKVCARQMEVYAGFAEHVDTQIGRVIDVLEQDGLLDNTLVFYLLGDNGASAEGLMGGQFNEYANLNGIDEGSEQILKNIDKLGTDESFGNYAVGWAIAMDTPFTWAKQVASNFGGIRNGLIVRYPNKINTPGQVRTQFHHCTDIVPTILELTGIPHPNMVDGVKQRELEGVSMVYSFEKTNNTERHNTQYFCVGANYGIYHEGWFAGVVSKIPWLKMPRYTTVEQGVWELYNVDKDFSMSNDLAFDSPEKLSELKELFFEEARKYNVLPIDSRGHRLFNAEFAGRPDFAVSCKHITLNSKTEPLRETCFPNIKNHSFKIEADIEVFDGFADGVILAQGGKFGGWAFYVKDNLPTFTYNYVALENYVIKSKHPICIGTNKLTVQFSYDGGGMGKGGLCEIFVNNSMVASGRIEKTVPTLFSFNESTCVGRDIGTPVTDEYTIKNSCFRGNIYQIDLTVLD